MQQQWKYVPLVILHKRKIGQSLATRRASSLVAQTVKVLLKVIALRLNEYRERVGILQKIKSDFQPNRSNERWDACDRSAKGIGEEETSCVVCILYRQSVQLR